MKCRTFSEANKCCQLLYNNPFKINMSDINPNCNGISDKINCCWYKSPYLSEIDLKKERLALGHMRRRLGIIREKK